MGVSMSPDIVLAYTPITNKSDWQLRSDADHQWFYEPSMRAYCQTHNKIGADCWDSKHIAKMWGTHYLDLSSREIASEPPRVYINHHPAKGEWEKHKTIDDVRKSKLYVRG